MDQKQLLEMINSSCAGFPAFQSAKLDEKKGIIVIEYEDFRPEENPWCMYAMVNDDYRDPLFNLERPCIEFLFPVRRFETSSQSYSSEVASECLPWVDHLCLVPGGPIVKWDVQTGTFNMSSQVRFQGRDRDVLEREIGGMIRDMIALNYLVCLKKTEMSAASLGSAVAKTVMAQLSSRMKALLGISDEAGDNID